MIPDTTARNYKNMLLTKATKHRRNAKKVVSKFNVIYLSLKLSGSFVT